MANEVDKLRHRTWVLTVVTIIMVIGATLAVFFVVKYRIRQAKINFFASYKNCDVVYADSLVTRCEEIDIDPFKFHAMVGTESEYKINAKSRKHAFGRTQMIPRTMRHWQNLLKEMIPSVKKGNADFQIYAGILHLNGLLRFYDKDWYHSVESYNTGRFGKESGKFTAKWHVTRWMDRYETILAKWDKTSKIFY